MSPRVSIIVLNWNGRHLLAECLSALRAQTLHDFEIIVVDNGSQDGSPEWLAANAPEVSVICNSANLGFASQILLRQPAGMIDSLGIEVNRAGWRCLYVPHQAVVLHAHSATTKRGSPFKRRLLSRNKWWAIARNYPFAQLWPDVPATLVLDLVALFSALMLEHNLSAVHGRWEALRGWRRMWRKRQDVRLPGTPQLRWRQILAPIHLTRLRA